MIRYSLLFSLACLTVTFIACGPAAENRQKMHERAKVFQDSIANVLKQSMAEAEAPGNPGLMVDTAAARKASEAAQTGRPK